MEVAEAARVNVTRVINAWRTAEELFDLVWGHVILDRRETLVVESLWMAEDIRQHEHKTGNRQHSQCSSFASSHLSPLSPIPQNLARCIEAARAHHAPTGVGGGAAHVETLYGCAVVRVAADRACSIAHRQYEITCQNINANSQLSARNVQKLLR
jgi:hypothetical protein